MWRLPLTVCACVAFACGPARADDAELKSPLEFQTALLNYHKEVLSKLEAKDFAWLDKEAGQLRESKERTQIGGWKIRQFSRSLSSPWDPADEAKWSDRLALLQEWSDHSKTPFSLSMLGAGHMSAAWAMRGHDYASRVPKQAMEAFQKEVEVADKLLEESYKQDPKNPDIYRHLLGVGLCKGWPKEKMDETLKQAIAVAPDYLENFMEMATYVLPRWFGQKGDWQRFINSIPERVPGDDGAVMFTETIVMSWPYTPQTEIFGEDREDRISWKKMKHGFEILRQRYPESAAQLNREAFFAGMAQDMDTLAEDLKILDEKNMTDATEWGTPMNLEIARKAVKDRQ